MSTFADYIGQTVGKDSHKFTQYDLPPVMVPLFNLVQPVQFKISGMFGDI
jgi:hypothetical protein